MASVTKACGTEFVLSDEHKERIAQSVTITKECFDAKATDGKIVNAHAMEVYFDVMAKYKDLKIVSEEELYDLKSFENNLQTAVDTAVENNDGFIDFDGFKVLINLAKSAYIQALFSTLDLNMDGFISKDEMNTIVAGIDNPVRAKMMGQIFDTMKANFDADKDGKISLKEFTESMKTMKW